MENIDEGERAERTNNAGRDASIDRALAISNLMLPFTHGIDASAIISALAVAQHFHSTLVVLSLIRLPETPGTRSARFEAIQQSRDFLEFVQHRAAKEEVPIKRVELYTHHPTRTIRTLARELECAGILIFVQRGAGVLLATDEVKQLLDIESLPLYITLLPPHENGLPRFRWLSRWLRR